MSSNDNNEPSQPSMWGSPAQGAQWGSPVVNLNKSQSDTSNVSLHTPLLPKSASFPARQGNDFRRQNSSPSLGGHFSTPPNFSPRPLFHSSPMHMNPRDNQNPRFNQNFHSNSRGRGMSSHGKPPYVRHKMNSSYQRSYSSNASLCNPGHSSNIEEYIHHSMLEDPWKNLPATPIRKTS